MGGCIAGCYACQNDCSAGPNTFTADVKKMGAQSVLVEKGDDYIVHRAPAVKDLSLDAFMHQITKDFPSMVHVMKHTCEKHATRNAVSYRKVTKIQAEKQANGKDMDIFYLGERENIKYSKVWEQILGFANGLKKLGIEPGHKVALYEETRVEWLVSCYGIWCAGATPVTVYANLGEDALIYALKESEVDTVVCNAKAVKKLKNLCAANGVNLKSVIYTDDLVDDKDAKGNSILDGTSSWNSVTESGLGEAEPKHVSEIKEGDLAVIMYTSGTTGDPKGVVLSQGNVVSAVLGIGQRLGNIAEGIDEPTYLAYLPLAHILEFAAENYMYYRGYTVCYSNPRILSDTTARPHGDLKEFKPVLFAGVPRVFDGLRKVIESRLPEPGSLRRTVFDRAFNERKEAIQKGITTPGWDAKVFANTAAALGGRCKWIISGGAPLSGTTQLWMATVFGAFTGQGYGLTETGAATTVQRYWDLQTENTGGLLNVCEVKLRNADIYKVTDVPPRGEVLIRGPSIAQGYYKQPEKTKEAFLEDGFFATGDVGSFAPDGTLKIVGRTKALAKNALGEYIAMEALESTYVLNDLVLPNGICIVVDPLQAFIVAVALTDESKAMAFAKKNNIDGTYPAILRDAKFIKASIASLAQTGKENGKKPFELPKNVRFYADEWTPENGILTAAMKLKRREIDAKYGADVKAMYDEASSS